MSAGPPAPAGERTLVIATNNPGKLREFTRLLGARRWDIVGLAQAGWAGEIEEPAETYEDNALAKATAVSAALGLPALADDSGIEVMALGGWPGPRSARWLAGAVDDSDRLAGLIDEVDRRCPGDRRVRYACVVALSRPGAVPVTAFGECRGILVQPAGSGGFGYDPGFLSDDLGITFGNAGDADKDRVSHRARALRGLVERGALEWPDRP